jgi:Tol biopolymer transport system component
MKSPGAGISRTLVFIGVIFVVSQVRTQQSPAQRGDIQVHRFSEVAISSDGNRVVYVNHRKATDVGPKELLLIDLRDPQSQVQSVHADSGLMPGSQHDIAWSPDESRIVFFGTDTSGRSAAYIARMSNRSVRRARFLEGVAASPRWSTDGKAIAMLYIEGAVRAAGPLSAAARDTGTIEDRGDVQRIALLDPSTSDLRQISPLPY